MQQEKPMKKVSETEFNKEFNKLQKRIEGAKKVNADFQKAEELISNAVKSVKGFNMDDFAYYLTDLYVENHFYGKELSEEQKAKFEALAKEAEDLDLYGAITGIVDAVGWSSSSLNC